MFKCSTLYMALSDAQALTNNTGYISSLEVFVLRKRRKAGSAASSFEGHEAFSGTPFGFLSCIVSTLLSHLFSYVGEKTAFFKSTLSVTEKSEICKYRKFFKKEFASKYTKEALT